MGFIEGVFVGVVLTTVIAGVMVAVGNAARNRPAPTTCRSNTVSGCIEQAAQPPSLGTEESPPSSLG